MHVKYFWDSVVFGDDPLTLEREPSVPFSLGVQIFNDGAGSAHDVEIVSSKPEIIENEKGLLLEFDIVGVQVNFEEKANSLQAVLGEIKVRFFCVPLPLLFLIPLLLRKVPFTISS